jgi:alanine racemase
VVHIPLRLRIDGEALVANWRWLAQRSDAAACGAAVKADGYGLGAAEVVRRLAGAGCRDFFVATWPEAEALQPWIEGLTLSVLHGVGPDDVASALVSPARPVLSSPTQISRWREHGGGGACDLMVDTGMNRLGVTPEEASAAIQAGLTVATLMSHLACADEPAHPLNEVQLRRFQSLRRELPARRYSLANSAGICLGPDYAFDLTRPGLALYGGVPVIDDGEQAAAIRQVVTVEAQIVQIRAVPAGASVGYGATYVAPSPRRAAILNVGYADGFLRLLAPGGQARSGNAGYPLIGRVSMDLVAVDVTAEPGALAEGDWLALDYRLPDLARRSGISQYELLTTLGPRFERLWS